jgi:hypothetical protein
VNGWGGSEVRKLRSRNPLDGGTGKGGTENHGRMFSWRKFFCLDILPYAADTDGRKNTSCEDGAAWDCRRKTLEVTHAAMVGDGAPGERRICWDLREPLRWPSCSR